MFARQQFVDTGDHAVPVEQHVESHDRRDEDERDKADKREALRAERGKDAENPGQATARRIADGFLDFGILAQKPREFAVARFQQKRTRALDDIGQHLDEGDRLLVEQRQNEDCNRHGHQGEQDRDDGRRRQPREAARFETVGKRVEKIGEREARHEGQQNAREQPEQQHEYKDRAGPYRRLTLDAHGRLSIPLPGYLARSDQPPAS